MTSRLMATEEMQTFLDQISGLKGRAGNERVKKIVRRIVSDLFATLDDFDVSEDEFWTAVNFMAAGAPEFGLWAAGLGFEHFLDVRMDLADREAGLAGGTPRTIEGPLYVAGAPKTDGFARLDDGADKGEVLIMHGRVVDAAGHPVAGAVVDVWHANTLGNYSYFDKTQSDYNLRRRIVTDVNGAYKFRSVLPSGYAVPPGGSTEGLLEHLGRHGRRPAHVHFFVSAPGYRHLTTQINIDGDPDLHDDFAFATRDELIPRVIRHDDAEDSRKEGLNTPFAEIAFDFTLQSVRSPDAEAPSTRSRVSEVA